MGLLSALFPSAKAAGDVVKSATDLIDKAFYTDQEKADDARKMKEEAVNQYLKWLEATSGQNRARRAIALTITALWALTWLLSFITALATPWLSQAYHLQMTATTEALQAAGSDIGTPFMMVLAFYFSSRMLDVFKKDGDKKT